MTIALSKPQKKFFKNRSIYRGFVGGRGAGKSFIGALDFLTRIDSECFESDGLYMIAAPTYPMLRDTTLRSLKTMMAMLGITYTFAKGDGIITLDNGADILLRTTNEPDRMRGPNLSGIWLDEASLMIEEAYEVALPSLREHGRQGWMSLTFTPKGKAHWTYKRLGLGAPDTFLVHSHTSENKNLPANFASIIERQYGSGQLARQELGGEFLDMGNVEWPSAYWEGPEFWYSVPPSRPALRVIWYDGAGDPSARTGSKDGKRESDWHAAAMLSLTDDGHLWYDMRLWRGPQEKAATTLLELCREFNPDLCGVEANFGGDVMVPLLNYAAREMKRPDLAAKWQGLHNTLNKETRIRRLGSYFAQGTVHLRENPGGKETMLQLEQFPIAVHDDGPDAMDGALQLATKALG